MLPPSVKSPPIEYIPIPFFPVLMFPLLVTLYPYTPIELSPTVTVPVFVTGWDVFEYIPTFASERPVADPRVIVPLLTTAVFSDTIPSSFLDDVPVTVPVFVKIPVPFASIPTIPPVVFTLLLRTTFTPLLLLIPPYIIPIPVPVVVPEYLYVRVFPVAAVSDVPRVYIPTPFSLVSISTSAFRTTLLFSA